MSDDKILELVEIVIAEIEAQGLRTYAGKHENGWNFRFSINARDWKRSHCDKGGS